MSALFESYEDAILQLASSVQYHDRTVYSSKASLSSQRANRSTFAVQNDGAVKFARMQLQIAIWQ
jgi:hypothetical protein